MKFDRRGFTLIELLIVVAIIAILALIAVPNFLEAQTRSKVSRVKAELRSVATGLEAYFVDNNAYCTGYEHKVPPVTGIYGLFQLSTPIAYMTQPMLRDPFHYIKASGPSGAWRVLYIYRPHNSGGTPPYVEDTGSNPQSSIDGWSMWSRGPDMTSGASFDYTAPEGSFYYIDNLILADDVEGMVNTVYDPTNGTVSVGNIYRVGGSLNNCLRKVQSLQ